MVAKSILYQYPTFKTYKKYCDFDNLPNHFIIIFKRLSTWPMHGTHAVTVSRRWCDRFCTLFINIQSMRMKLSMKNKFPNHILFPELPTFFENDRQSNSLSFGQFWTFVYSGRHAPMPNSKNFQGRYWEFTIRVSNFQQITNQIPCYYSYWSCWLRILQNDHNKVELHLTKPK